MVSAVITFIVGVLLGGVLLHFLQRSHWQKRIKSVRQELFDQHADDLERVQNQLRGNIRTQRGLFDTREREWLSEKDEQAAKVSKLAQQLAQQQQENHRLQADYEAQLVAERGNYDKLSFALEREKKQARENVDVALKQTVDIEAKNVLLQENIKQLEFGKAHLQKTHQQEKEQLERTLKSMHKSSGIDVEAVIEALFPSLILLRDSIDECDRNQKDIATILRQLQALENRDFKYSKKVHSTSGEWSEVRAPHMNMMRIYYRKENTSPSHKCEVLISRKKDTKTQDRDLAWLRKQPKKR